MINIKSEQLTNEEMIMKKILLLIPLIFLVGCASIFGRESPPPEIESSEIQVTEKNSTIADLEYQVRDLTETLNSLQVDYYALQDQSGNYLCETRLENMKYQDLKSALAVLNGWFAIQPEVRELSGEYTTLFWDGIESRIHTIRYISTENDLSTTTSFLIFFEEAGWKEGVLSLTNQCWLDFPD